MNAEVHRAKAAEFLGRERGRLVRTVRRWLADAAEADAEDIVQDVALRLFDQADITAPIRDLSSYIYQALRNKVIDLFRGRNPQLSLDEPRAGNERLTLASLLGDDARDPAREAERGMLLQRIFRAMDRLRPEDRAVLVATELEGRPFRELARQWDVPLGTLLARKARAIRKIRRLVESF